MNEPDKKPSLPDEHREHEASVEIVTHKNATKKQVKRAKEANKHLVEVLKENHFTLQILVALRGQPKPRVRNGH